MSARNKLTGSERRKDILLSVKNAVSSTACRFSGNQQHVSRFSYLKVLSVSLITNIFSVSIFSSAATVCIGAYNHDLMLIGLRLVVDH